MGASSGSRPTGQASVPCLDASRIDPARIRELAECLKRTVHLARVYSHGTGTIFEKSMNTAERLAERAILDLGSAE